MAKLLGGKFDPDAIYLPLPDGRNGPLNLKRKEGPNPEELKSPDE